MFIIILYNNKYIIMIVYILSQIRLRKFINNSESFFGPMPNATHLLSVAVGSKISLATRRTMALQIACEMISYANSFLPWFRFY